MTPDVDHLVEQVLAGQTEAYRELIRLFEKDVWTIVATMLHEREATADLVQEILVETYFHLNRYERGRDFGVWLRSIARNRVREELRRKSRETRRFQVYREHVSHRFEDHESAERRRSLLSEAHRTCRSQLPIHSLEVLDLRYVDSLSVPNIASKVGRSVEAVHQLLYRVRLLLRECIEKKLVQP